MISKNSNIMTRKKCATCASHKVKSDVEPCRSCIKLKDGTTFTHYKEALAAIQVEISTPAGSQLVDFTVLQEYEDGSVLAIPDKYKALMRAYEGKPKLFSKEEIRGYEYGESR